MTATTESRIFTDLRDAAPPAALRLRYSWHALDRAYARSLPVLDALPPDARLADRDDSACVFRLCDEKGPYFLIVADDGTVLTTFRKTPRAWRKWRDAKTAHRRCHCAGTLSAR